MAEYIERESVLDSLRELSAGLKDILKGLKHIEEIQICNAEISTVYECAMRVTELPTADVVPVVRCCECISSRKLQDTEIKNTCVFRYCLLDGNFVKDNHYCSYGEGRCE